jgi:hypothetical protein
MAGSGDRDPNALITKAISVELTPGVRASTATSIDRTLGLREPNLNSKDMERDLSVAFPAPGRQRLDRRPNSQMHGWERFNTPWHQVPHAVPGDGEIVR